MSRFSVREVMLLILVLLILMTNDPFVYIPFPLMLMDWCTKINHSTERIQQQNHASERANKSIGIVQSMRERR